ncbi:MAG: GNAT family N-acetyltransferase [Planctomycetota bacterium]
MESPDPLDGTTLFRTERLLVRRWLAADADALLRIYGDERVARYVGDSRPLTPAERDRWLEVTAKNYATRGYGMSTVCRLGDPEPIGFCGLVHPGGQPEVEIKYALAPDHWGRGLASEAARALLEWGVAHFAMAHVIATIDPQNAASARILEKLGFRWREQTRDENDLPTDVFEWRAPSRHSTPD